VGVPKFPKGLPRPEKLPLSETNSPFISMLLFVLKARDVSDMFSISPATRLRLSHRKLHDGEYPAFLRKISPLALLVTVVSFLATQQADPILT
jgi:hypothetical protein